MKIKQVLNSILKRCKMIIIYLAEIKNIKKKKKLYKDIKLTKEQIKAVDDIWIENYGKKISKNWHRLYTSYMGEFNKYYFPEILFTTNLLNKLNPYNRKKGLADKVLTEYLFNNITGVKTVKNYLYNCNGFFYDDNGLIQYNDALERIKNIGEVIIKPSIDTSSGKSVRLLNIKNGIDSFTQKPIEQIFNEYNKNYMIQERIKQHEIFARLNRTSVNTIRINTYICEGRVYISPLIMRMGRNGSIVDNAHAGGIAVGIKDNGYLRRYSFTEYGEKYERHPDTGIKFDGYKLIKINEMIDFVKKYHYRIPHMGIIAWDLTLDEEENIVIIETNITCPGIWISQYCNAEPFFGENTEKMIRKLKEKEK